MSEDKLIDALKHDTPDILLSWLPNDQILDYCFSNRIPVKNNFLYNCPPLHCVAAFFGAVQCLQLLYDRGNRFKAVDKNKKGIIDFAAFGGHYETFEFLINIGYISSGDLLQLAIDTDSIGIIKIILENNLFDKKKVFFSAVEKPSFEIIKYFSGAFKEDNEENNVLNKNINETNDNNNNDETDINNENNENNVNKEMKDEDGELLINSKDEEGKSALQILIEKSKIEIVRYLLSLPLIDTNPINPLTGQSLLHIAAKKQNSELISSVLKAHGFVGASEPVWDFMTLDFKALENDVRKSPKIPEKPPKPIDVNLADLNGDTPLIVASREGGLSVLQALLMIDQVDVNISNKNGDNALITACKVNRAEVVSQLVEKEGLLLNEINKDGVSALHISCRNKNKEIAFLLLNCEGIDANIVSGDNSSTPLHIVSSNNESEIFECLLNRSDIKLGITNDEKMTPVHIASKDGNTDLLKKLLEKQTQEEEKEKLLNATDLNGLTPLHAAARFNHLDVCETILKSAKIDVNKRDNDGWTPLHYAARNAYEEIVKLLVDQPGIDVNVKDNRDKTPLYFAMDQNVRVLLQGKK